MYDQIFNTNINNFYDFFFLKKKLRIPHCHYIKTYGYFTYFLFLFIFLFNFSGIKTEKYKKKFCFYLSI